MHFAAKIVGAVPSQIERSPSRGGLLAIVWQRRFRDDDAPGPLVIPISPGSW